VSISHPVYPDVVVITEIQELLPSELGNVVSVDRVGDSKAENNVLDKAYRLLGAYFGQGSSFDPFSELVNHDKQVVEAPGCFLEGSQEVLAPPGERLQDGDGLEPLGRHMDLSHKLLAPLARPYHLYNIGGGHWPVKTLPEGLSDHAPRQSMISTYSFMIAEK
jgi:hypothetical protein